MAEGIFWVILRLLLLLMLVTGVSSEAGPPPAPPPLSLPTPDPAAYAGWQEFHGDVMQFQYPSGWWVLADTPRVVAIRNEVMVLRIELPSVRTSASEQFSTEADPLAAATVLAASEQLLAPSLKMLGIDYLSHERFERAAVGGRDIYLDTGFDVLGVLAADGTTADITSVVLPYVACFPDDPCSVLFASIAEDANSSPVWQVIDKIVASVEIMR